MDRVPLARWLIVAAFALALLTGLGDRGLVEPDEGRYAEIAREMVVSGDWLVPHLNGIPHFQKPPVIYWTTAISLKFFGINEWAARLPSALAAAATLLLAAGIGRRLGGPRIGLAAAGVLLTCLEFFVLARSLTPDMMMTFWIVAAIACFLRRATGGGGWCEFGFFAAMGLGFLTKGPVAVVVPVFAVLGWNFGRRRAGLPKTKLRWLPGLLLSLAIAMSWFTAMALHDPALSDYFVKYELMQRFASKTHGRSQPLLFFVPVLVAGILPWLFVALAALLNWTGMRKGGWRISPTGWLLVGWTVPPLIILSLSGSKLFTYVLPLMPALALWLAGGGNWKDAAPAAPRDGVPGFWSVWWRRIGLVCGIGFIASPALAFTGASLTIDRWKEFGFAWWFGPSLGLLALACAVGAYLGTRWLAREPSGIWPAFETAGGLALALLGVGLWLLLFSQADRLNDRFGRQASVKSLAALVKSRPDYAAAAVFTWRVRAHGFEFYLGRTVGATRADADVVLPLNDEQRFRLVEDQAQLLSGLAANRPAYGLMRRPDFEREFKTLGWSEIGRAGEFVLATNALTTPPRP